VKLPCFFCGEIWLFLIEIHDFWLKRLFFAVFLPLSWHVTPLFLRFVRLSPLFLDRKRKNKKTDFPF